MIDRVDLAEAVRRSTARWRRQCHEDEDAPVIQDAASRTGSLDGTDQTATHC